MIKRPLLRVSMLFVVSAMALSMGDLVAQPARELRYVTATYDSPLATRRELRYSAVMALTTVEWLADYDLDASKFVTLVAERQQQEFRLEKLHVYAKPARQQNLADSTKYAGIWVKDNLAWTWRMNMTKDDFSRVIDSLRNAGFRPTCFEFDEQSRLWAAAWVEDATVWDHAIDLNETEFDQELDRQSDLGRRTIDFRFYLDPNSGELRHSAIWGANTAGHRRGISLHSNKGGHLGAISLFEFLGLRIIDSEAYMTSEGMKFSGVYIGDRQVSKFVFDIADRAAFDAAMQVRVNEGRRPVDFSMFIEEATNAAPQITAIADTSIKQGETFEYQASASDPNPGDVLSFSDNTSLFDIDAETGRIEFTASNDDVGVHSITIYVSDGELSDSTSFVLTVINVNDAPLPFVLLSPPDGTKMESLQPTLVWQQAMDIDPDDALIYNLLISTRASFADTVLSVETGDTSHTLLQPLVFAQNYYWKVRAIDLVGAVTESQQVFSFQTIINDVDDGTGSLPTTFALQQNYPNPFNPETRIRFSLPQASQVRLEVHNLLGQRIAVLLDESRAPGEYALTWQAVDASGRRVPSGIYILSLHASDPASGRLRFAQTRKMVVVE